MGARKRVGTRWSASFSARADLGGQVAKIDARVDVDDALLGRSLRGARSIMFRWRYDGRNRNQSFTLPDGHSDMLEFRRQLVAAIAGDWEADASGRPIGPSKPHQRPGDR